MMLRNSCATFQVTYKVPSSVRTVWVLISAQCFSFPCFRLPMETWKQRWFVSTGGETYQVHLLCWQTNMQVSLLVFTLLPHNCQTCIEL